MEYSEKVVSAISQAIVTALKKAISDNSRQVDTKLKNVKITGDNIMPLSIDSAHIKEASIDIAKVKDFSAEVANIAVANIQNATIDTAQIRDLAAYVADITVATIETADITWAEIAELSAAVANIAIAEIGRATIKYAQIEGLTAGSALITEMVGGKVGIADLAVTDANIVELNANKINAGTLSVERLVIVGSEKSIVYALNEANGTAQLSQTTIDGGSITRKTITADQIVAQGITAECLNVKEIFANEALIGAIKTANLDAAEITSNSAFISKLTTSMIQAPEFAGLNLASTEFVKLEVKNHVPDELSNTALTITQNGINMTGGKIAVNAGTSVEVVSGGKVKVDGGELAVDAGKVSINAGSSLDVQADGKLNIAGGSLLLASQSAMELASGATFNIKTGGIFTLESGNFVIDKDGNVELKGRIEAASGEIGGWIIDPGMLYSGSGANRVALSTSDTTYAIWAGGETAVSAPFRVGKNGAFVATNADITGKITSSSGEIGGWNLATGYLYSGSGANAVYLSTVDAAYTIWAGADTATSAPFRVGKNGSLYSSDAEITGKITANDGQIGGWFIGTNLLYAGSGTNRVALSTGDATYAMWAGNEIASSAPFRVTKDGKVYLTRVMALANETDTTPSELDLSNVAFWKLNRAVKTLEVNDDILTIGLYNGTTVNFKKASSVEYMHISQTGGGSGNVSLTVSAMSDKQEELKSRSISLACDVANKWVWISSSGDSGSFSGYVNCSEIYEAGWSGVTPSTPAVSQPSLASGSDILLNVPMTLKASNGATLEHTIVVNAADAYDRGEAVGYADGKDDGANSLTLSPSEGFTIGYSNSQTVTATTTKADGTKVTKSVTLSAPASNYSSGVTAGANSLSITPSSTVTLSYGEARTVTATTKNGDGNTVTKAVTIVAPQSNYNTGWNECRDACTRTAQYYYISYNGYQNTPLFTADGLGVGTGFVRVLAAPATYFIPAAK